MNFSIKYYMYIKHAFLKRIHFHAWHQTFLLKQTAKDEAQRWLNGEAEVSTETCHVTKGWHPWVGDTAGFPGAVSLLRLRREVSNQRPPKGIVFHLSLSLFSKYLPSGILFTSQPVHHSHGNDSSSASCAMQASSWSLTHTLSCLLAVTPQINNRNHQLSGS